MMSKIHIHRMYLPGIVCWWASWVLFAGGSITGGADIDSNPDLFLEAQRIQYTHGMAAAAPVFEQAARIRELDFDAQYYYGLTLETGNQNVTLYFQEQLKKHADSPLYPLLVLWFQHHHMPPLSELEALTSKYPEYAPAHFMLGERNRVFGHHEKALSEMKKAYELDPGLFVNREAYTHLLLHLGDLDQAKEVARFHYRVPFLGAGEMPLVSACYFREYYNQRQSPYPDSQKAALNIIREWLEQVPANLQAHIIIARHLLGTGSELEEAFSHAAIAYDLRETKPVWRSTGEISDEDIAGLKLKALCEIRTLQAAIREAQGKLDDAMLLNQQALALSSENPDSWLLHMRLLRALNRGEEALQAGIAALRLHPGIDDHEKETIRTLYRELHGSMDGFFEIIESRNQNTEIHPHGNASTSEDSAK